MRTRWTDFSEEAGMKRLPLVATMLGVILLAGCHDRQQFNFFYPFNLPALVSIYLAK